MSGYQQQSRTNHNTMKSAEFLSAKRIEEEALMAALGMKSMPPPGFFAYLLFFFFTNTEFLLF